MTNEALVDKLRKMRTAGKRTGSDVDVMTRLFGVIFCEEIRTSSATIVDEYKKRKERDGNFNSTKDLEEIWPGSPNATVIQDGLKLAQFVDPHYAVVRKWKG